MLRFDDISYDSAAPAPDGRQDVAHGSGRQDATALQVSQSLPTLTLHELNAMVRETIELHLDADYWVVAELASVRPSHGHCYMELVEKDTHTNTPVAKANAVCWRGDWPYVSQRFQCATGQALRAGMKVLFCVRPRFHEAYGFSWIISDIDPSYTLGDMARRRQEIINQLTAEGVIDMNKQLPISPFANRLAVISSATAAGYGDFCSQLADNDCSLTFTTELFPAVVQGEGVEQSIINALNLIHRRMADFDIVVIIRGGGSVSDLSGFDTLALAEHVANFPLPVITGIGHDRDKTVLDIVACVSVKTPTAVAAWIIDNLATTLATIDQYTRRISTAATSRMQEEQMRCRRLTDAIHHAFAMMKERQQSHLSQLAARLALSVSRQMTSRHAALTLISQRLPWLTRRLSEREDHRLAMLRQRITAVDPRNILRRGYSITIHNGHAVSDSSVLHSGDRVKIIMAKGNVEATVDTTTQDNE